MKPIVKFMICCLIFALVWLGTSAWWTFSVRDIMLLFLLIGAIHLISAVVLGYAVGRGKSLVLEIGFVAFVTVLMFFYTDFSQRELFSLLTGKPRLPFAYEPVPAVVGFLGSLAGVVMGHLGIYSTDKPAEEGR